MRKSHFSGLVRASKTFCAYAMSLALLAMLVPASAFAAATAQVPFNGVLRTSGGAAVTTAQNLKVCIFDEATDSGTDTAVYALKGTATGNACSASTAVSVTPNAAGEFSLLLGNTGATYNALPALDPTTKQYWVEFTVGSDTPLTRIQLGSALSAYSANITGATAITGATGITGATTVTGAFSQSGANTFGTGTGAVSLNGATTVTGTNTFATGSGAVTLNGDTTVSGTKTLTVGTGATTLGGTLGVTGDLAVNTNKFNVTAASGNTTIAGTLGVTGAITGNLTGNVTGNVSGTAATVTGAAQAAITSVGTLTSLTSGAITSTGNLDIGTGNFTVAAASGNTTIAGTLGVTGAITGNLTGNVTGNATTATSATSATTATNIAGGVAGGIAYQSGVATTSLLGAGAAGQLLTSGGAGAPTWSTLAVTSADITDGTIADADVAAAFTRDTEWDTAAEINAATTDADFLTAVVSANITDGTIATADFAAGAVDAAALGTGAVTAAKIGTGAVTASKLQAAAADLGGADVTVDFGNTNGAFNTNITTDGTITATGGFLGNATTATSATSATSATTATTATNVAGGATGSLVYQTGAGATSTLAVGTVGKHLVSDGTNPTWATLAVASADITDGTIADADVAAAFTRDTEWDTAAEINAATTDADFLTAVVSANITDGTIATADFAAGAVDAAALGTGAVTAAKIGTGAVTASKLQAAAADLGGADVTVDFGNTNGAFNTNITTDGTITATGGFVGNASTATSATTATNVAGGATGSLVYQTGAGATSTLAVGTVGKHLVSDGTNPTWATLAVASADITDGTIADADVAAAFTRDTEWDTAAEINAATTDADFLTAVVSANITDDTITAADINATLTFADSDLIDLSSINASSATEGLKLPQAADVSTATAEGQISWDTDGDVLYVGTGAAALAIGNPFGASIDSAEITDGTIADADVAAAFTRDTEWDTAAEINAATTDADFLTAVVSANITDETITAADINATLTFADADLIDLSSINASSATEGLKLPQSTDVSTATAEGQISWDTDGDTLYVGTGAAALAVGNPFGASIDSAEITDGTIANGDLAGSITNANVNDDLTISGGTVNNSVIGGVTPAAASFTTASTSGLATLNSAAIGGGTTLTKMTVANLADNTSGWVPDGAATDFTITADAASVGANSLISVSLGANATATTCSVYTRTAATDFRVKCSAAPADAATLQYMIVN